MRNFVSLQKQLSLSSSIKVQLDTSPHSSRNTTFLLEMYDTIPAIYVGKVARIEFHTWSFFQAKRRPFPIGYNLQKSMHSAATGPNFQIHIDQLDPSRHSRDIEIWVCRHLTYSQTFGRSCTLLQCSALLLGFEFSTTLYNIRTLVYKIIRNQ